MTVSPILACGPSADVLYAIFGILGAGALSFISGVVCLCLGSKSLGAFLAGAPVALFGLVYLWSSLH